MAAEDLIGVTEAAGILGCGRSTVIYLITEQRLPANHLPMPKPKKLPAKKLPERRKYWLRRGDVEALAAGETWRRYKKRGE